MCGGARALNERHRYRDAGCTKKWNYHAEWNQNTRFWREDFQQLANCGFDLLRWQVPWSLIEPTAGEYRWDLLDPQVELATRLGMEIFYPIVHFNMPSWIAGKGNCIPYYPSGWPTALLFIQTSCFRGTTSGW